MDPEPRERQDGALVWVIIAIVMLSVATGFVAGGDLRRFEALHVHWWVLALAGLVLQGMPLPSYAWITPRLLGAIVLLASYVLLLAFLTVNRWIPAAKVMAAGLLLNLLVVGLNAGMPVAPGAIATAGGTVAEVAASESTKHHVQEDRDLLPFLGDVIPLPEPAGIVLSVGDVLLYLGIAWFIVAVMTGRSRENPRPLAMWFLAYRGKHAPEHWRMAARYRAPDHAEAERPGSAR